ncbi:MAG: FAD-binding oxidoreductase [Saprospiraceae bacterium]|nr:FAD-binding oxidoreductase [Saprospiraceae bacterium]
MENKLYDFAIIGQGIAGTLLVHFLLKEGKSVLVIDNDHHGSSSIIAAGIVNPITGKNFVKSWRINDFLPVAREVYDEISALLHIQAYSEINIVRALDNSETENNWLARTADPDVAEFMVQDPDVSEFENKVNKAFGYGEFKGTLQVHLADIIRAYKQVFISTNDYYAEIFEHHLLSTEPSSFIYKNHSFKEIIFCEGYKGQDNPFYQHVDFGPAKGEVLLVKIPGAGFRKMYKDKIFIVHLYDDMYWVGSGYEWDATDDLPTEQGRLKLTAQLDRILKIPYDIIDHKAAIRPTLHSRRPIIKLHPTIQGMYIFNGLGTKGASISPFVARQFAHYLVNKNPEDLIL